MKEHEHSIIKFPLLVSFSLMIMALAFLGIAWRTYFKPDLSFGEGLAFFLLFIFLLLLISFWILNLLGTQCKIRPRWMALCAKWMLFNIYFYLARFMGLISFQTKPEIQESFLHFNNRIVLCAAKNKHHQNILLLLPHCLQSSRCKIRITADINECASCGQCDIAALKAMAQELNVHAAVATGGSLARKIILDTNPDVIVAVACHRDLTEGVRDAWSFPIFAVLNERPNGPCFETTVDLKTIEYAIREFQ